MKCYVYGAPGVGATRCPGLWLAISSALYKDMRRSLKEMFRLLRE